ncbi:MAG: C10 family peptidase [Bacteroidales bacterium]|nr:C10 family peptidase [Bacteroidales bacterium]
MRKVLLFFAALLLLAVPVLKADDISLSKARQAAETFFAQCGVDTRAGSSLSLIGTDQTIAATRSSQAPAWYVFNRQGGGFVIVSGSDAAFPILGYSLEHTFCPLEEMPSHMREWMELYSNQINERRSSGQRTTEKELARWESALTLTRVEGAPASLDLQTADWGQGAPFNQKCPIDSSVMKRCVTGCVATAISEVLYFYKQPAHGSGTIAKYTKNGVTVGPVTLGEDYQWDNMLPKYKDVSYTSVQADAVATLCAHVGAICKLSYGVSSTAGSTATGVEALIKYMGYDKGAVRYSRSYHSLDEWRSILKNQIAGGDPVLFAGNSGSAGHAFVVDGYDEADRFLINFGWNATSNGYYQLDAFGSYTVSQVAYIGVKPSKGNSQTPNLYLKPSLPTYNGVVPYTGTFSEGSSFKVRFGQVYNYGFYDYSGRVNFAHMDKNGSIKSIMRSADISFTLSSGTTMSWSGYQTLNVTMPIERGDRVVPVYRASTSDTWHKFSYSQEESFSPEMMLHIRDFTSVSYDKASGVFTLKTFAGTVWSLVNASEETVASGTVPTSMELALKCSDYPSGSYRLSLTMGTQFLSLTLIF